MSRFFTSSQVQVGTLPTAQGPSSSSLPSPLYPDLFAASRFAQERRLSPVRQLQQNLRFLPPYSSSTLQHQLSRYQTSNKVQPNSSRSVQQVSKGSGGTGFWEWGESRDRAAPESGTGTTGRVRTGQGLRMVWTGLDRTTSPPGTTSTTPSSRLRRLARSVSLVLEPAARQHQQRRSAQTRPNTPSITPPHPSPSPQTSPVCSSGSISPRADISSVLLGSFSQQQWPSELPSERESRTTPSRLETVSSRPPEESLLSTTSRRSLRDPSVVRPFRP